MRICLVLYDPQEFGGLEEYAVSLAIALHQRGEVVSVLSTHWVPSDNQYLQRLRLAGVTVVQPPRWLSLPASDWQTKDRILAVLTLLATPVALLLAALIVLWRRCTWAQASTSAAGWIRGQLQAHLVAPDRWRTVGRLLLAWWRLRWQPDVLHVQGYTTTLLFAVAWSASRGIPVVYEEHQTPDPRFDWWRGFAAVINQADIVVAVSETSAEALRSVCGVSQPIVVRQPLLADPSPSGEWRRRHGVAQAGPLNVTTVARLSVAKGLTHLCDAIAEVQRTHPDVCYRVYGDGDMRQELLAHAAALGLDGPAIFVGPFGSRAQLAAIMGETDVFVMSSLLEGQPLGVIEAMAYGRPIVATAVGGIPEVIEDGVNGLLCPPADAACLAEKMRLLLDDGALRTTLGAAARRRYVSGHFQPSDLAEFFLQVYERARRLRLGSAPATKRGVGAIKPEANTPS